ncbi:DUF1631 domain-containing protein [Thiocystis violacea]|uniref:DUF1631 domain-containing protein n=1 Tax=Thiocystis violacea TaxID=13725 RepID=UPI001F5B62F0|nr:DUF1631 domain-containing protein [Thiocystis violacea]
MTTAMHEDAVSILAVCRDRLIDGVSAVFTRHVGHANDELLAMADRAGNLEQQHICFAATQFLSNRAPQLLQQLRAGYVASFETVLKRSNADQSQPVELPNELSLVDDEEFEQDLTITKLTSRAAFNCSQQLVALDRRLAVLLKVQRLAQDENPLHPGVIYKAVLQTLTQMGADRHLALVLLQSFESHTAPELPRIYAEVNRYLAESGILPTISLKTPLEQAAQGRGGDGGLSFSGGYANGAQGGLSPFGQVAGPGQAQAPQQDVFSQLLQAMQSMSRGGGGGGNPGWLPAATAMAPQRDGGAPQSFSSAQLVAALGNLQRGPVDPAQMPGLGSARIDPYSGGALQQIRSTPMANWSHPMDAMTMDIVSMLFDAMFDDPDLPASVRAEIAKLQIPVLKVALLDKTFFSERKHPARRMLDAIAHSGIGRSAQDEQRLVEKIHTVVDHVVKGFDSDIQVFDAQVAELVGFLKDEETLAQSRATDMVSELESRERKEVAPSRAGAEIELRINRRTVPTLIADFLDRHWRLMLVDAFARSGERGEDWKTSLRLMDELIWSVAPKASGQERDRLVVMLPAMLKGLREGLQRVGIQGVWDGFFSQLIQLHVSALRKVAPSGLYPQDPHSPLDAQPARHHSEPAGPREAPAATVETVRAAQHERNENSPTPTSDQSEPPDDQYLDLVRKLEVGAWLEFQSERGTRNTLRLNWVSEFRRVFLFTNRQGENAMTLAATSLAEHLRKGTARLLSQNPLTDRAVAQVLEKVMPASAESGAGSRPRGYAWE